MFVNLPPALPLVKAGKLRALRVTMRTSPLPPMSRRCRNRDCRASRRSPGSASWRRRRAKEIVARLSVEIGKIVRTPEMRERLLALGAEPVGGTPEEFSAVIGRDIAKWTPLAKTVGIKVD
jgi:tripartite-type tricarboxylate transporter receptor subunit TctC